MTQFLSKEIENKNELKDIEVIDQLITIEKEPFILFMMQLVILIILWYY
jgi:hypothetical protein